MISYPEFGALLTKSINLVRFRYHRIGRRASFSFRHDCGVICCCLVWLICKAVSEVRFAVRGLFVLRESFNKDRIDTAKRSVTVCKTPLKQQYWIRQLRTVEFLLYGGFQRRKWTMVGMRKIENEFRKDTQPFYQYATTETASGQGDLTEFRGFNIGSFPCKQPRLFWWCWIIG